MTMSKFKTCLTVLLLVILGCASAASGAWLGWFFGTPLDGNDSLNARTALEERNTAPNSKYNVLLMGTDTSGYLTDVMMIYQLDPRNKKVNVLSIPRDTRIYYNNRVEKINAAHSYGKQQKDSQGGDRGDEYAIRAVRELTGIPIHHYVCINTAAFRQIIDAIGGFDYDVPRDMDYEDSWQDLYIHLKKGYQHLDGDKAEQLVRFRHYPNGDIDRVAVQQDVLRALVEQKVNITYVHKVPEIFSIILDNIDTDMTPKEALGMAFNVLDARGTEDGITTYTVDGSFWNDSNNLSYWAPNLTALKNMVAETFGYVDGLPINTDALND